MFCINKEKEREEDGWRTASESGSMRITTEEIRAAKKSYEDEERKTCWCR